LTYDHTFDKLTLNAVGGYSYQDFLYQGYNLQGGNFVTDLAQETVQSAADFSDGKGGVSSYKNGARLVAFFGRVNLNWNSLAYLSAL
jgi:iron complex outermembrane receptor protein